MTRTMTLTINGKAMPVDAYGMSDYERDRIADKLAEIQSYLNTTDERMPETRISEMLGGLQCAGCTGGGGDHDLDRRR